MKKNILIIDDDPVVLRYLESILADHGYNVSQARDGIEAMDMIESAKPDLITLDLQMPEQWGPRFYRRLTRDPAYRAIPVIVVSGLTGSRYSIPKAAGYLSKPFEPDALLQLVREQIGESDVSATGQ